MGLGVVSPAGISSRGSWSRGRAVVARSWLVVGVAIAATSIAPPAEDDGIPVPESCEASEPGTASEAPGMVASISALALVIATATRRRRRLDERSRAVSFRTSAPA